jgi:phosphatidylinositol alpha-1,6-mannosyltransferase
VLRDATIVIAAGGYAAAEGQRAAGRPLPVTVVPPGVDCARFHPISVAARVEMRRRFGLPDRAPLVLGVSRLVPRKGFDVLIEAAALIAPRHPGLVVAIGGSGRDETRLRRLAERHRAPVRFLGRVAEADLAALHASADVFAMVCRTRWAGLEQEGFGIVFVEAAAAGVAQLAGRSGGAAEAVLHEETGLVVEHPGDPNVVAIALGRLLDDDVLRARLGTAARQRAEREFSYDVLAGRLGQALGSVR